MDVVLLSRLQFAFTIMFYYIFPPLTIGLGVILAYLETRFYVTKKPIYAIARQQENGAVSCYLNAFIQSTSILNVPDCLSAIRNPSC